MLHARPSSYDISIIVPVFNCEAYLDDCINSLLRQRGVALELIFVNDGSTDRSASVIEEYCKQHSNILLVSQPNSGVVAARNRGIELAKGRYMLFVDADDSIVEDSLQEILSVADKEQTDVLQLTHYAKYDDGRQSARKLHPVSVCTDGISYFKLMQKKRTLIAAPYNHLVRSEFLKALPFRFIKELPRCQDLEFFTKVMLKAKRIRNYTKPYYIYKIGTAIGGSGTRKNFSLLFECYEAIKKSFSNFASEEHLGAEMARRLDYLICSHIYGYSADVFKQLPADKRAHWIKFIRKHIFYNCGWMRPHLYLKMYRLNKTL